MTGVTVEPGVVRERVVEAADALFYARGYRAVGMDRIRDLAGVSLRRLYAEFASKDEIIDAVLERRLGIWQTKMESSLRAHRDDPVDQLLRFYDTLGDWFAEDGFRGCGFLNAAAELGPSRPRVSAMLRLQKDAFRVQLEAVVARTGAGPELAAQLAILAEGAQATAAVTGTPEAATQARRAAAILIEVGLSAVSTQ